MTVSWESVVARRMRRHGLSQSLSSATDAARAAVGIHAQMMSAATLSLAARVPTATPTAIATALAPGGELVKTYGPRGTVHLLPREDLPLWCAALSAAPPTSSLPAGVRLDAAQTDAVVDVIGRALDGEELDTDELDSRVVAELGAWAAEQTMPAFGGWWPRWRQAISTAAHRGVLAFGVGRGAKATFVNPGVSIDPDAEGATGWLLRQYLWSFGPATPAQFARWMAAPTAWGTGQFSANRDELEAAEFLGQAAFACAGDADFPEQPASGIRLLPHFDSYVVGGYPRERLFPGAAAARALNRGQAGNFPVLLRDGVVAGVWHLKRSSSTATITIEPVVTLARVDRESAEAEANRIATFLGLRLALAFDTVRVGPHA